MVDPFINIGFQSSTVWPVLSTWLPWPWANWVASFAWQPEAPPGRRRALHSRCALWTPIYQHPIWERSSSTSARSLLWFWMEERNTYLYLIRSFISEHQIHASCKKNWSEQLWNDICRITEKGGTHVTNICHFVPSLQESTAPSHCTFAANGCDAAWKNSEQICVKIVWIFSIEPSLGRSTPYIPKLMIIAPSESEVVLASWVAMAIMGLQQSKALKIQQSQLEFQGSTLSFHSQAETTWDQLLWLCKFYSIPKILKNSQYPAIVVVFSFLLLYVAMRTSLELGDMKDKDQCLRHEFIKWAVFDGLAVWTSSPDPLSILWRFLQRWPML